MHILRNLVKLFCHGSGPPCYQFWTVFSPDNSLCLLLEIISLIFLVAVGMVGFWVRPTPAPP